MATSSNETTDGASSIRLLGCVGLIQQYGLFRLFSSWMAMESFRQETFAEIAGADIRKCTSPIEWHIADAISDDVNSRLEMKTILVKLSESFWKKEYVGSHCYFKGNADSVGLVLFNHSMSTMEYSGCSTSGIAAPTSLQISPLYQHSVLRVWFVYSFTTGHTQANDPTIGSHCHLKGNAASVGLVLFNHSMYILEYR